MRAESRYLRYLEAERSASRMYRALADMTDGERREALLELAAMEDRHAAHWMALLHKAGAQIPPEPEEMPAGNWIGGLGDIAIGAKRAFFHNAGTGTIFSATGEIILPTGDREKGFGKGTTVFEPFA